MIENNRLSELLSKKLLGKELSEDETRQLEEWLQEPANRAFYDAELNSHQVFESVRHLSEMYEKRLDQKMAIRMGQKSATSIFKLGVRFMASAIIIGILVVVGILYHQNNRVNGLAGMPILETGLLPGGNKAVLTLSDGSSIILDSAKNGILTKQGNSKVLKLSDGLLTYAVETNSAASVSYNTITVPVGGQYQVSLPDHSKIWLNSNSSLKFPTSFIGKNRTVELTGEAYLEIAKNKAMPFQVKVSGMTVTALGTAYDIMAYPEDSSMQTTLLQGSIKVTRGRESAVLVPGDQAQVNKKFIITKGIDTAATVAWKNGITSFKDEDIKGIMRKISRWYDVHISYEGEIPERKFMGGIPRNSPFSDLLKVLELNHIHTRVDGKTLIVRP